MNAPAGLVLDIEKLQSASIDDVRKLYAMLRAARERKMQSLFYAMFPEEDSVWDGPDLLGGLFRHGQTIYARDRYEKHLEFYRTGAHYRERCFMAANRVGKTVAGAYELACHLTGLYPDWWPGRRFNRAISAWAAGKSLETTRDIVQFTLFGAMTERANRKVPTGRGIVPGHLLDIPTMRSGGVANLIDTIKVKHVSGNWSELGLKSYEQGRSTFEGTGKHIIWFDEEPPLDCYGEALIRTATMDGITMITFTPLEGISDVVRGFLPEEMRLESDDPPDERGWDL